MEQKAQRFLLCAGILPRGGGYRLLKMGIVLFLESKMDVRILGKPLYQTLGELEGKSVASVQKTITNAIERAYLRGNLAFLERTVGNGREEQGRPTNGEFIAAAANYIAFSREEE